MSTHTGKVRIIPVGRAHHVAELDIKWRHYPKADKAIQARKAAALWARAFYKSAKGDVFVEMGTISPDTAEGKGAIHVGSTQTHYFVVIDDLPTPVPAGALFDAGGR
ncbi:hypothetical protein [Glutamicibacter sp. PS]|uniref:hypothetical protein n=1 Tax=Glutamicibacter sp. PS TaxID=3075634 RepID=UPI002841977C|nr:hypothetical protein [Glutamicibacter sp. PS]MDR4533236.1 hypothetical protein [Glutamicibacter sp. PS]